MSLPESVTILGYPCKIKLKRIEGKYGECCVDSKTITLNPKQIKKDKLQIEHVLLHEILHMILGITGQSELLSDEQEEGIVMAMEHALVPLVELVN